MKNDYYPNDEAYLVAIADAMHDEYKAIVDAGFLLQIDDPDLPDGWQFMSKMSVPEYRKYAELRVERNHGLHDIPRTGCAFLLGGITARTSTTSRCATFDIVLQVRAIRFPSGSQSATNTSGACGKK
jgi:hypothetical protein